MQLADIGNLKLQGIEPLQFLLLGGLDLADFRSDPGKLMKGLGDSIQLAGVVTEDIQKMELDRRVEQMLLFMLAMDVGEQDANLGESPQGDQNIIYENFITFNLYTLSILFKIINLASFGI